MYLNNVTYSNNNFNNYKKRKGGKKACKKLSHHDRVAALLPFNRETTSMLMLQGDPLDPSFIFM